MIWIPDLQTFPNIHACINIDVVDLKWHGCDFQILLKFTILLSALLNKGISNGQIIISEIKKTQTRLLCICTRSSCHVLVNIHVAEIFKKKKKEVTTQKLLNFSNDNLQIETFNKN